MTAEENPFMHVSDPDALPQEERERYLDYWARRTPSERLSEIYRLNLIKWGDEVFENGMDKSKIEVVDMATGEVLQVIQNTKNK